MDKETASKVKPLVDDKISLDALFVALDDEIEYYRKLNDIANEKEVLKHQGAIAALQRLKNIRDSVLSHFK